MNWYLVNPDVEDTIKALEASGKEIPESLYPPRIFGGYESWLEAFWDLGTDRGQTDGRVGPIPRSAVMQYRTWMDEDDFDLFQAVIRKLDATYLTFLRTGAVSNQNFSRDMFKGNLGKGIK